MSTLTITVELSREHAAALKRFAEKVSFQHARSVLYPHVPADIRSEQAHQMVSAFGVLDEALADAGARAWPWIETGSTR